MINNLPIKTRLLNTVRMAFKSPSIERLLLAFSKGQDSRSIIGKLLPSHYLYKKGSHRVVSRHGLNFYLDISDLVDWFLYYGLKETAHEQLYGLCESHYTVMDIGTNNGAVLMQLGRKAKDGFVYGFEPDPRNYARCLKNLSLNNLSNVKVSNIALGSKKGNASLVVADETNLGMNRINIDQQDSGPEIAVDTLDEFVSENNIETINLIKIDTEGFELNVLMGASGVLERLKPTLFIELDDDNLKEQGQSAKMLVDYLKRYQYKITRADTGAEVTSSFNFINCHFDIIAQ